MGNPVQDHEPPWVARCRETGSRRPKDAQRALFTLTGGTTRQQILRRGQGGDCSAIAAQRQAERFCSINKTQNPAA